MEITTGPLGQGLASAVGFAYSQRRMRGLFDADAPAGTSPFDHTVWVIASDGDLQEGVTSEASSLAGHQELGNLVVIYDENHISIEDDTDIAFTEDVLERYEAYGWHTQRVDWTRTGEYKEDVQELHAALLAAKAETCKPSIISLRTIIGYPAPKKQNTGKIHGSALGAEEVAALKKVLGLRPRTSPSRSTRTCWPTPVPSWTAAPPPASRMGGLLRARGRPPTPRPPPCWSASKPRKLPADLDAALPVFEAGKDVSTRAASGKVLNAIGPVMPELWGGSADLAESNNTTIEGSPSFIPASRQTDAWKGNPYGRVLHFGIREHAAASIVNGISLHGAHPGVLRNVPDLLRLPAPGHPPRRAHGRPVAVRLDARLHRPGRRRPHPPAGGAARLPPCHPGPGRRPPRRCQRGRGGLEGHAGKPRKPGRHRPDPPEHPHLRPGRRRRRRRHLRLHRRRRQGRLRPGRGVQGRRHRDAEVILIGTGSEVQLAVQAREALQAEGIATRVVSMPCVEWFNKQDAAYRESVLPAAVKARVSVEAGLALGWKEFVGDAGRSISLEHFGASADYKRLFQEFGITAEAVAAAAKDSLAGLTN